jgi:phosphatidylinositol 3-kinase
VDVVREEWNAEVILEEYEDTHLSLQEPVGCALNVDPSQRFVGVQANKAFVAHSAVQPVVFCCELEEEVECTESIISTSQERPGTDGHVGVYCGSLYSLDSPQTRSQLYALKIGDDLRQDALVLQMFRLMEVVWAEHGLQEVRLQPYSAMPVSTKEGMLAYVPGAKNFSKILVEHEGDLHRFIVQGASKLGLEGGADTSLDRLCGSSAGYCVATYLLGIGDRHLDNIMMTEDGHFFHIDFGYILGDDPKPLTPHLRVPREVLEVLRKTRRYEKFKRLVGDAFLLLRQTARLWTALLSLTQAAGGNGVSVLQESERGLHIVRERLHLELDDDTARDVMIQEVEESAVSMMAVVYDKLHQVGLFWH